MKTAKPAGSSPRTVALVALVSLVDIACIFGIYLLGQLVVAAGLSAWGINDFELLSGKQGALLTSYIAGGVAMAAGLFGLLYARKIPRSILHLKKPNLGDAGYAVLGYLAYVMVLITVLGFISVFIPSINLAQKQDIGLSPDSMGLTLVPIFIALVVVPSITEELLFRGFLYNRLRARKLGFLVSSIITSLLFALLHGQVNVAIDTFILSMVMLFMFERRKNLWVAIFMHFIKNSVAFVGLFVIK